MELKEMIKVMQHFENGGDIEFSDDYFKTVLGEANKKDDDVVGWDWAHYTYRIKEQKQKQKVTIEKWLMQSTIDKEYRIFETSLVDTVLNFKKVKLIKSYEVEL